MISQYITGSSGFIGHRLLNLLSKSPGATKCIGNDIIKFVHLEPCEKFFFLSTYGNMAHHSKRKSDILRANVTDLANVLTELVALRKPCKSFVFVSSSSVTLPVQTTYSRTKRAAEEMILAMPIPGCIVRPFSVTGTGEQKEHLIPTLIRSCLNGEPMNLVLSPAHDYVDVDDVVNGLAMAAHHKFCGILEFGSTVPITNEEVMGIVEKETGKKANVKVVDRVRNYDSVEWFCRTPAPREIFNPVKTLRQSIKEMIEACQKQSSGVA